MNANISNFDTVCYGYILVGTSKALRFSIPSLTKHITTEFYTKINNSLYLFISKPPHIIVKLIHYSLWTIQLMSSLAFESCRGRNTSTEQLPPRVGEPLFNMEQLLLPSVSPVSVSAVSSASRPITAEQSLSLPSLSGYVMAVRSVKNTQRGE